MTAVQSIGKRMGVKGMCLPKRGRKNLLKNRREPLNVVLGLAHAMGMDVGWGLSSAI